MTCKMYIICKEMTPMKYLLPHMLSNCIQTVKMDII